MGHHDRHHGYERPRYEPYYEQRHYDPHHGGRGGLLGLLFGSRHHGKRPGLLSRLFGGGRQGGHH